MTQGRWTTLAVLLLAALWLAGCGGGGDGGVKQDLEAQLEALMAERDAAKTAQATAEASRAAAEEARATADAARKAADEARATAETERDAAKAAQMEAEADKAEAEAAQAEAVAAQAEAEAAQTAAEATRDAAVKAKTAAETARDEARDAKTQAEIDLIAAESAQALAERQRDAANTNKTDAETARDAALAARQTAETQRDEALAAEMTAEDALAVANASKTMTEGELVTVRQQLVTANASLQTTQDALEDANDDLKDAQDDLKEAQDDLQTANDEFATVKKERDDAVRDLARAEGTLEGLRSQLTEAQQDAVDAEQRRREAEAEANRRIEEAETQADLVVRAPNLLAELGAETIARQEGVTVSYALGATRATFEPTAPTTRGTAPSVPGSWNHRASFSSTVGVSATDTFYLYSNIESPAKRKFWQVYGAIAESSDSTWAAALARAGTRAGSRRIADDMDNDRTDDDIIEYTGSRFDGASGTFRCTATGADDCILKNAATVADGLVNEGGTWTFTPTPSGLSNRVGSNMPDDTYLYFGIWYREPKDASATASFQWIRGGGNTISAGFNGLEGTATFNGGAVGKYALKAVAGREARIGTFTAKATFTASFGDTNNTLSGTINEFREGGSSLGADWSISLIKDAADTLAVLTATGTNGETHGSIGNVTAQGTWAATLHGSDNHITELDANRDKYPKTRYPTANLAGVVGWFNAYDGTGDDPPARLASSNAAIAGAFGAACTSGAACGK